MTEPQAGAGNVVIKLGDQEVTLRPSLQAAITLSGGRGGMSVLTERCLNLEFAAIQSIIIAGMGGKTSKDLPELIYQAGILDLSAPCIKFLHIVSNGGRPIDDDDDDEGGGESPLENGSQ